MKICITISGKPQGKGRPRTTKTGHVYTPEKTRKYEERVKQTYRYFYGENTFKENIPLKLSVLACYRIPKSTSKKVSEKMLKGEIRPTVKPDADNILKIIADALNGTAYHDDKQIAVMCCEKVYGEIEGVVVTVEGLEVSS